MNEKHIGYSITTFSDHYNIQISFVQELSDLGLIELGEKNGDQFVNEDQLPLLEHFIRLHQDFHINAAGIDVVEDLLGRINELQDKIRLLESKASLLKDWNE